MFLVLFGFYEVFFFVVRGFDFCVGGVVGVVAEFYGRLAVGFSL